MRRASTPTRTYPVNATGASPACERTRSRCASAPAAEALEFGPIDELREKHGDLAQIPPMPEPSTSPNIVIGSCQAIDSDAYDVGEGYVANPLEVE